MLLGILFFFMLGGLALRLMFRVTSLALRLVLVGAMFSLAMIPLFLR